MRMRLGGCEGWHASGEAAGGRRDWCVLECWVHLWSGFWRSGSKLGHCPSPLGPGNARTWAMSHEPCAVSEIPWAVSGWFTLFSMCISSINEDELILNEWIICKWTKHTSNEMMIGTPTCQIKSLGLESSSLKKTTNETSKTTCKRWPGRLGSNTDFWMAVS